MKYRSLPSGGAGESARTELPILIIPVSSAPERYSISYPETDDETFLTLLLSGRLKVLSFDPVPAEAVEQLRSFILERLRSMSQKTVNRFRAFFSGGIAVAVLGVINWTVPDPLPLIDEGILSIGGLAAVVYALYFRKNKIPEMEELTSEAAKLSSRLEAEVSPLLSFIYKALELRERLERSLLDSAASAADDEKQAEEDAVLLEEEVKAGRIAIAEIEGIMPVLDALMNLSASGGIKKITRFLRSRASSPLLSSGVYDVSSSVLEVYRDLYSQAEDVLSSRGKKLE